MELVTASEKNRADIIRLLTENRLPVADLPARLDDFIIVKEQDRLIALVGLERYGSCGLLRSLVVDAAWRNKQIAGLLVRQLEQAAGNTGIRTMYLLTETAEKYFGRAGYSIIRREEVPDELRKSSEFSHVCPKSAVVMKKELTL